MAVEYKPELMQMSNEDLDLHIDFLDTYLDLLLLKAPNAKSTIAETNSACLDAHNERFRRMGLEYENIIELNEAIYRLRS